MQPIADALSRALQRYTRGAMSRIELLDHAFRLGMEVMCAGPEMNVYALRDLRREVAAADALRALIVLPAEESLLDEAVVALASGGRPSTDDRVAAAAFRDARAAQIEFLISDAPAARRLAMWGIALRYHAHQGLSTPLLEAVVSATSHDPVDEHIWRNRLVAELVERAATSGDIDHAVTVATTISTKPHLQLLDIVRLVGAESPDWPRLMSLTIDYADAIRLDEDPRPALYAAAAAVASGKSSMALQLMTLAGFDGPEELSFNPELLEDETYADWWFEPHYILQEIYAFAALTFSIAGRGDHALRCARISKRASETPSVAGGADMAIPAASVLAAAEREPAKRLQHLRMAYLRRCGGLDNFGALDGRLALQVANTYLQLAEPVYAAYFLAQAIEKAPIREGYVRNRAVDWQKVRRLLDATAIRDDELFDAAARLRALGYLAKPAIGDHFEHIDSQWCWCPLQSPPNSVDLVRPKPMPTS